MKCGTFALRKLLYESYSMRHKRRNSISEFHQMINFKFTVYGYKAND